MKTVPIVSLIHNQKGFTLIELVVVISIIMMLVGGGIVSFTAFRSGKIALNEARIIADTLTEARRVATAGEKPTECDGFPMTGYSVTIGGSSVSIAAVCPGGTPPTKTRSFDADVTASQSPFIFSSLSGATDDGTVDVCVQSHLFRITVTKAGNVTTPTEVDGGC